MFRLNNTNKQDPYRVWLIFCALSTLGFTLCFTVSMVYMAEVIGLNPLQLVLVGTVLEISCFLFEIPTGIVADVYSRRLSVIIGSILIGIGFVVQGAFATFAGVLLAQVLWGIGATFHSGACDAWLADEIGEQRVGQAYLRASQVGNITSFFAILLSVGIAVFNIQLAIIMGGVMHLITALYLARFMPENGFTPKPAAERETFTTMRNTLGEGMRVIRGRPVLLTIIAITFITGAFSESFDRLSTPHLLANFTFPLALPSVVWFGLLSLIGLLIGASLVELIRRRVKTDSPESLNRALGWVNAAMLISVLIFALSGNLLIAVLASFAVGALRGVKHPLTVTWLNQGLDPQVRATVLSTVSQTDAFGQIAGGPVLGWVGNSFGLRTALGIGGLLLLPASVLYARALRRHEVYQEAVNG